MLKYYTPHPGVVVRDPNGVVLLAAWRTVPQGRDAEEVEAMAIREGFRLAAEERGLSVVFESDSCSIVSLMQRPVMDQGAVRFIVEEVRQVGSLLFLISKE